jgi:hypothetical protein
MGIIKNFFHDITCVLHAVLFFGGEGEGEAKEQQGEGRGDLFSDALEFDGHDGKCWFDGR